MPQRMPWLLASCALAAALVTGLASAAPLAPQADEGLLQRLIGAQAITPRMPGLEDLKAAAASYRAGRFAEVLPRLEAARTARPSLPPARLMLARMHLASGRREPARRALEEAVISDPDYPGIYLQLGELALLDGHRTDAFFNFREALGLLDRHPERLAPGAAKVLRGNLLAGLTIVAELRRAWPEVERLVTEWLALDARNGRARQRLARALFLQGRTDEAFAELGRASADVPALEPPEVAMGAFYEAADKLDEADAWYRKGVAAHPEQVLARIGYGRWLLRRGELDGSQREVRRALELDPKSRPARLLIGLVQRSRGDLAAAQATFEALVGEDPAEFAASNQLALVLLDQDDEDRRRRGAALAERNARAYPGSAEARTTLAWAYLNTGRLERAERMLQAAAAARGGRLSPDMTYYVARTLEARGRQQEIPRLLEGALRSTGRFTYREQARAWLERLSKGTQGDAAG